MNELMIKLTPFLDALYAPQKALLALSPYISLTLIGLIIASLLGLAGIVLARLGMKPLWSLVVLVPTLGVAAVWVLALRAFPRER